MQILSRILDNNVVDNINNEKDIVVLFRSKYKELYNSVSDKKYNQTVNDVEKLVDNKCNKSLCNIANNHNVTSTIVKNAIMSLKKGKDDEIFEMYSDDFLNALESVKKNIKQNNSDNA